MPCFFVVYFVVIQCRDKPQIVDLNNTCKHKNIDALCLPRLD